MSLKASDIFDNVDRAADAFDSCILIPENIRSYTVANVKSVTKLGTAFIPLVTNFDEIKKLLHKGKGNPLVRLLSGGKGGKVIPKGTGNIALTVNPAMLIMAVALVSIDRKLSAIQKTQEEILQFLKAKEKAELRGNLAILQGILDEYKFNWDNLQFKSMKSNAVQTIKSEAQKSIIFHKGQIESKMGRKTLLQSDRGVKNKFQEVQEDFKDYELALYLFAFSSFLEVMLLENYDSGYLESVARKVEQQMEEYMALYQQCQEHMKEASQTSVEGRLLGGVSKMNRMIGGALSRITGSDNSADAQSDKIEEYNARRAEHIVEAFSVSSGEAVATFVDNIRTMNAIHNGEIDILFDGENIYYQTSV